VSHFLQFALYFRDSIAINTGLVTANGMAQVEQLFSKLDSGEQAVQ
jgi:hypothetical protein